MNDAIRVVVVQMWKIWSNATDEVMPRICESLRAFNFAKHCTTGFFSQNIWPNLRQPAPDIVKFLRRLNAWVRR